MRSSVPEGLTIARAGLMTNAEGVAIAFGDHSRRRLPVVYARYELPEGQRELHCSPILVTNGNLEAITKISLRVKQAAKRTTCVKQHATWSRESLQEDDDENRAVIVIPTPAAVALSLTLLVPSPAFSQNQHMEAVHQPTTTKRYLHAFVSADQD